MISPRAQLALSAAPISFTGVFARLADVSGEKTALYRLVYALPVLVAAFAIRVRAGERPKVLPIVAAVGLLDGGAILLYHLAIEQSGVAVPTLVVNLQLVVAAIGARCWSVATSSASGGCVRHDPTSDLSTFSV